MYPRRPALTDAATPTPHAGKCCHSGGMRLFLVRLVINALALWFTTFVVAGITVTPYAHGGLATVLTYLLVAFIFGLVNGIIGTAIRVVGFPLYIVTLGLISFIVNGVLLLIVAGISSTFEFGLAIAGFWDGVIGAFVLSIIAWILGIILRPLSRRRRG